MKTGKGLGYFAMAALIAGTVGFSATSADAGKGNGNGKDNNPGHANGKGNNPGKANGHAENGGPAGGGNGSLASARGSLNAAHASGEAFMNANSNSRVGMLTEYMDAMLVYGAAHDEMLSDPDYIDAMAVLEDPDATKEEKVEAQATIDGFMAELDGYAGAAGEELLDAANKDSLIDKELVHSVNSLLDGKYKSFSDAGTVHDQGEQDLIDNLPPAE